MEGVGAGGAEGVGAGGMEGAEAGGVEGARASGAEGVVTEGGRREFAEEGVGGAEHDVQHASRQGWCQSRLERWWRQ